MAGLEVLLLLLLGDGEIEADLEFGLGGFHPVAVGHCVVGKIFGVELEAEDSAVLLDHRLHCAAVTVSKQVKAFRDILDEVVVVLWHHQFPVVELLEDLEEGVLLDGFRDEGDVFLAFLPSFAGDVGSEHAGDHLVAETNAQDFERPFLFKGLSELASQEFDFRDGVTSRVAAAGQDDGIVLDQLVLVGDFSFQDWEVIPFLIIEEGAEQKTADVDFCLQLVLTELTSGEVHHCNFL